MLQFLTCSCLTVAVCAGLTTAALADRLYLKDGSEIEGKVEPHMGEAIKFTTGFAGTAEFSPASLRGLTTSLPLTVSLATGERMVGQLSYGPNQGQRITSPTLGTVAFDPTAITGLWEAGAPSPELAAARDRLAGKHVWTGKVKLGLSGASGNSDRLSVQGRAEAHRNTDFDRLTLFVDGRFATEDDETTQNEVRAGGRLERDFSKHWLVFGNVELERDTQEDISLRAVLTVGTGVFLIKKEKQTLKARAGIGYQQENFFSAPSKSQGIVTLGYDYMVVIRDWAKFTHEVTLFPSITSPTADYRLESIAAVEVPISQNKAWKVSAELRNQFDARTAPGTKELDTTYFLNLSYDFK